MSETVPKIQDGPLKDWPQWVEKLETIELTAREARDLPEYSCTLPDSYKRPIAEGGRPWIRDLNFFGRFGEGKKLVYCEYVTDPDPKLLGIKSMQIKLKP